MVLSGEVRALRLQNGPRDQGIERRSGLEIFYKLHNPQRVADIDKILQTHTAEELVITLQALYNAVPAQWVDVKGAVLGRRGEERVNKMRPGYKKPPKKTKVEVFRKNERYAVENAWLCLRSHAMWRICTGTVLCDSVCFLC
jgi:hypothetical protein